MAHTTNVEADPEADVSLANGSSPEEDDVQGFTVQAALRLSKAGILAEVDELEVVHAQLVDAPPRPPLTDAVVLAIHTEVLEALLQCWVRFKACVKKQRLNTSARDQSVVNALAELPWLMPCSCRTHRTS